MPVESSIDLLVFCIWALCGVCASLVWRVVLTERDVHRLRVEDELRDRETTALRGRVQYLEIEGLKHRTDLETCARLFQRQEERLARLEAGVVVIRGNRTLSGVPRGSA